MIDNTSREVWQRGKPYSRTSLPEKLILSGNVLKPVFTNLTLFWWKNFCYLATFTKTSYYHVQRGDKLLL